MWFYENEWLCIWSLKIDYWYFELNLFRSNSLLNSYLFVIDMQQTKNIFWNAAWTESFYIRQTEVKIINLLEHSSYALH